MILVAIFSKRYGRVGIAVSSFDRKKPLYAAIQEFARFTLLVCPFWNVNVIILQGDMFCWASQLFSQRILYRPMQPIQWEVSVRLKVTLPCA